MDWKHGFEALIGLVLGLMAYYLRRQETKLGHVEQVTSALPGSLAESIASIQVETERKLGEMKVEHERKLGEMRLEAEMARNEVERNLNQRLSEFDVRVARDYVTHDRLVLATNSLMARFERLEDAVMKSLRAQE